MSRLLLAILFLSLSTSVHAWGEHGHILVTEAATFHTPPAMPAFFHAAYPDLVYLANEPDRWRTGRGPLELATAADHFLDYEYVADLELPRGRYEYIDLLHRSGALRRYSIDTATPGFIPWRVAEMHELLVLQFRAWRQARPEHRSTIEMNVIQAAGLMAHYVGDSANPHHATIHYNGWAGVPNTDGFATDCGTHARFESEFVGRTMRLDDVLGRVPPLHERGNTFDEAIAFIRESQSRTRELYTLDRDGAFRGRGTEAGRDFAAARLALAASWLRDLWWSAWVMSGQPQQRTR